MGRINEKYVEGIRRVVEEEFPDDPAYSKFILRGKSLLRRRNLKG